MATHCFVPLLGKRVRLTALDECGRPPAAGAENSVLVTDGFVTISLSAETEDGAEIITRKANGSMCVNEKMADSFKRFTVEIEFCGVNPGALAIASNAEGYDDYAGDLAGITIPEGDMTKKFALELWTGMSGVACGDDADEASGYIVLPFLQAGVLGDIEINGEDAVNFSVTGAFTKGQNNWGVGPYNVLHDESGEAAPLPTALDPFDHLLLMDTGLAPPPSSCDLQAMPAALTP